MSDLDYDLSVDQQIADWEDQRMHELHDMGMCAGPGWCDRCGDQIPTEF